MQPPSLQPRVLAPTVPALAVFHPGCGGPNRKWSPAGFQPMSRLGPMSKAVASRSPGSADQTRRIWRDGRNSRWARISNGRTHCQPDSVNFLCDRCRIHPSGPLASDQGDHPVFEFISNNFDSMAHQLRCNGVPVEAQFAIGTDFLFPPGRRPLMNQIVNGDVSRGVFQKAGENTVVAGSYGYESVRT